MAKTIAELQGDIRALGKAVNNPEHLNQAGNYILAAAKMKCSGFRVSSGELRNSLSLTVDRYDSGLAAHVGTNKEYAMYVEYGTGQKGAASNTGTSPEFQPTYTMHPWWIHESMIDSKAAEEYHWFYIDTKDGRFYRITGQPAHPYLYPAIKDNEKAIKDILVGGWENAIK